MVADLSDAKASYRQILRSTSVVGGATVGSLVFGLARTKGIALLAGTTGIGLFGVLNTLFNTGTAIAGLNLWATGVRQVGATPTGSGERARAETALWLFAWVAAVVGGFVFWIFEKFYYVPNTPALADEPAFPWIAVAVALSILNSAQLIILQVNNRIGAIAHIRLWGALLSAILAVAAVYLLGTPGLYVAVLAMPIASILVAFLWSRHLPRSPWQGVGRWVFAEWRGMLVMGIGLTITNLTSNISQLVLRTVITTKGGLAETGLFQASWTLSNVNLTVVLSAMVVEYYPRLTAGLQSKDSLSQILNQQIHVALLILGPILSIAVGFSPVIVSILYSYSFIEASYILQWQIVGDVFKVSVWAMGFVLLALGSTSGFILASLVFDIGFVALVWVSYPYFGIMSTGLGYVIAQIFAAALSFLLLRQHDVALDRRNTIWIVALAGGMAALATLSNISFPIGVAASLLAFFITTWMTWREARRMDLPLPFLLRRRSGRQS